MDAVHQADDSTPATLWARSLEFTEGGSVKVGNATQYDTGTYPSLDGGDRPCAEVHGRPDDSGTLWYRTQPPVAPPP